MRIAYAGPLYIGCARFHRDRRDHVGDLNSAALIGWAILRGGFVLPGCRETERG